MAGANIAPEAEEIVETEAGVDPTTIDEHEVEEGSETNVDVEPDTMDNTEAEAGDQ